jgi:hypothetical protein
LMCLGEIVQFLHSVMVVGIRYGERVCVSVVSMGLG